MNFEVAMTSGVNSQAAKHLLQHYKGDNSQEDLCFALWRPSQGNDRVTGLLYKIIVPFDNERNLHGNASFEPGYLARVIKMARQEGAGIAFMHSHPGEGWQITSSADTIAERDVLAYPAGATGLPLIGMTLGSDGYWSARFWNRNKGQIDAHRCGKVRVVGRDIYGIHFDDEVLPPPSRREVLRRTYDSWGEEAQQKMSRLRVGIVGLGSVGCIVAYQQLPE